MLKNSRWKERWLLIIKIKKKPPVPEGLKDGTEEVKVFTDAELQGSNNWPGASYDSSNLTSANEVLGVLNTTTGYIS